MSTTAPTRLVSGTIRLDATGSGQISFPDLAEPIAAHAWSLTPVGRAAPNLHIEFGDQGLRGPVIVRGGAADIDVMWQAVVTIEATPAAQSATEERLGRVATHEP